MWIARDIPFGGVGLSSLSWVLNAYAIVFGALLVPAASSGAPIGGLLVAVDWRLIFLINVPIGVATVLLGFRVLPEVRALPGAATVVTVARIVRHPNALIEAHLFRSREFTSATIVLFLFFVAFSAWLLITVLFLQDEWHYSALRAGLAIAPGPLTAAVFAINSGRISGRFGRTAPVVAGTLCVAASAGYWLAVVAATAAAVVMVLLRSGLTRGSRRRDVTAAARRPIPVAPGHRG